MAQLSGNEQKAVLTITETNSFKQITHISLNFIQPSESFMKQYFGELVRSLREETESLKLKLKLESDLKNSIEREKRASDSDFNERVRRLNERVKFQFNIIDFIFGTRKNVAWVIKSII